MDKITNFKDNCIIIRIRQESIDIRGCLYEAVRRCWRTSIDRARKADYVLAVIGSSLKVEGVFKPDRWYYPDNEFCGKKAKECKEGFKTNTALCQITKRIAFKGTEITDDENYLHKLIPDTYFPGQNPVRYTY